MSDGDPAKVIRRCRATILLFPFLLAFGAPAFSDDNTTVRAAVETIKSDFETFYLGKVNLVRLGVGLGVAGVFANTNMDQAIRDWYQEDVRNKGTDDVSKIFKNFGTAYVTVPVYVGVYGTGYLFRNPMMEEWAQRSIRATLVGTPALLLLQPLLGGSRPGDGSSHWHPFQDNYGVSGHAFIGSVPFITGALMSENTFWKAAFYGLSTLTGISRIIRYMAGYLTCPPDFDPT